MAFIDVLNESSVTFIRDLAAYGWDRSGPGYEAVSPLGEIQAFTNYPDAQTWRRREVQIAAFGLSEIAPLDLQASKSTVWPIQIGTPIEVF